MKQFFEEYGGVILILIVVGMLILALGTAIVHGNTVSGTGIAGMVIDSINASVAKFTSFFKTISIPSAGA